MFDKTGLYLSVIAGACLSACAPSPMHSDGPAVHRPLGSAYDVFTPTDDGGSTEHATAGTPDTQPQGEITLRDALAAAMLHNPELGSFAYTVRVAEARAIQAGLWENPELEAEFENFAGSGERSGTDALETTIALSQTIPLGGDIQYRRRLAELHGELAGWDYEAARIALLTEVARAYIACLAAQRRVELARESHELARQLRESINRRVEAGDAPGIELSRAEVPEALAQIELGKAERALESARTRLAMTWAGMEPRFTQALGDLDKLGPVPSLSELASVINRNPAVARWAVELTARQAELKLAKARAQPDLTAGVGYRHFNDNDDDALVASVSIPLAVFDRGQGDIRAAQLGLASVERERRAAELRVGAALADAHTRLIDAYSEAVGLRDLALPSATESYDTIRSAFERGDISLLDVMDAERTLIELRKTHLDALTTYHTAKADVESLIGQAITRSAADTTKQGETP